MPERYITNSSSLDLNAIVDGFNKILELCISHSHNSVIIHLPSKQQITHLSNLLDKATIRNLNSNNYSTWNNISFNLNTERLEINDWTEDIVLSLYPTKRMTDNLNNLRRARAIVVVPWTDRKRDDWIRTWNPEIVGGTQENENPLDLDPRLERALDALTNIINLSTGLTHSSDKDSAIQLLRILHQNRIPLNPEDMRIWALQNDWTSDGANLLRDYAQGILKGRRYRTGPLSMWNNEYIQELLRD